MALFGKPRPPQFGMLAPRHAAACATLHGAAFAHGWSELDFERLLAAESGLADALFEADRPVAIVLSRVAADEAEVLTLVVAGRNRGRGLARQLLDRHMERLLAARARALFLEVETGNAPALALYRRAGFKEVGRRKGYYPGADGRPADALTLRRTLG